MAARSQPRGCERARAGLRSRVPQAREGAVNPGGVPAGTPADAVLVRGDGGLRIDRSCRVGLQADGLATNVSCSPHSRESSGRDSEPRIGRGVPPPSGVQQDSGPICVTGDLPSSISPSPPAAGHNGGRSASSRRGAPAVAVRRPAAGPGARAGRGRRRASRAPATAEPGYARAASWRSVCSACRCSSASPTGACRPATGGRSGCSG